MLLPFALEVTLEAGLKEIALAAGFDVARIARIADGWEAEGRLRTFVALGRHGDMGWMEETLDRRTHPRAMWPGARSALVVGLNYGPATDPMAALANRTRATISVYAGNADYHDLMKRRLKQVAGAFARRTGSDVKVFVDTAPLMEKPLAALSGLGWQGKHTNLVSRDFGSWLFLGVMLTAAELEPDSATGDHCGSCTACLDICPTQAFPAPYQIDARRCISYLTIEHSGPIPREFRAAMGNRIYGCDDCLAVCPWNRFARTSSEIAFHARPELQQPALDELSELDDAAFREIFRGSPIRRIGRDRFVRNVLIALGNSGSPMHATACVKRLDDPSALVRGAAVWALGRLDPVRFSEERTRRCASETDVDVIGEWNA